MRAHPAVLCSVVSNSLWSPFPDQVPLSTGFFQASTLEQIAILYSRWSSQPRDQTRASCITCIGRQIILLLRHLGSQNPLWWSYFNVITPLKMYFKIQSPCTYCGMKTLTKNWGGDTVHPITAPTIFFSSFKSWDGSKNCSHLTIHHSKSFF